MKLTETFAFAAGAFEKRFNCRLCLHLYHGGVVQDLIPSFHLNPFCTRVKRKFHAGNRTCVEFDMNAIQNYFTTHREPFFKRCPYGFLEVVFPIFQEDKLAGCLFAGPFSTEGVAHSRIDLNSSAEHVCKLPGKLPRFPLRNTAEFMAFGRLLALFAGEVKKPYEGLPSSRKEMIRRWITQNYRKQVSLSDLAEFLNLTPARASDAVRRELGTGFCTLLRNARIEAAKSFLSRSSFPADTVATECGFHDGSYFHRVFHKTQGCSPMQYRAAHAVQDV